MTPDEQVALANHLMRDCISPELPAGVGVCLLVFPHLSPGIITYIGNSNRLDMHHALRELLQKWDADAR